MPGSWNKQENQLSTALNFQCRRFRWVFFALLASSWSWQTVYDVVSNAIASWQRLTIFLLAPSCRKLPTGERCRPDYSNTSCHNFLHCQYPLNMTTPNVIICNTRWYYTASPSWGSPSLTNLSRHLNVGRRCLAVSHLASQNAEGAYNSSLAS